MLSSSKRCTNTQPARKSQPTREQLQGILKHGRFIHLLAKPPISLCKNISFFFITRFELIFHRLHFPSKPGCRVVRTMCCSVSSGSNGDEPLSGCAETGVITFRFEQDTFLGNLFMGRAGETRRFNYLPEFAQCTGPGSV